MRLDNISMFCSKVAAAVLLLVASHAGASIIFSDDFSSSDLSKTMSGAKWGDQVYVSVVASPSIDGKNSAQFSFEGNQDVNADAFSELRFDLGGLYSELWIQFYVYYPANYSHRDAPGPDNNKFLRLWGKTYDDAGKVGLSTWRSGSGGSELIADWNRRNEGIGPKGDQYLPFITSDDLGKWMKVRVHVVAPQSNAAAGSIQVWKNDNLIINDFQIVDSYYSGESNAYRYGYILGWSNSGYTQNTKINVDGVVFATSKADLDANVGTVAAPPNPPIVNVK